MLTRINKKDYYWNTLGVFMQNAISPILMVAVTRINGLEVSGLFSFAFSVSILIYAFAIWGGRTYQVSDVKREFHTKSYIMARVLLAAAALVVAIIFCAVNRYEAYKVAVIIALVLFKIIESFSDVIYGILQINGKLYKSGKSLTVKAILGMVVFVVVDLLTQNILLGIVGIVVVNTVVFLMYDIIQARRIESIGVKRREVAHYSNEALRILKSCIGVFSVLFLAMFSLNIPRYFIDMYSEEAVGYFGIIAMPITLIVLVISFILQPNIVSLSNLYAKGKIKVFKKEVDKLIVVSTGIGLVVLAGTALLGVWLLKLIFNIDISAHATELNLIVLGGIASALVTVYLNIFVVMRKVRFSFLVLLLTNLILIPVSYVAVMGHGVMGGVAAFTITNFIQLIAIVTYFNWQRGTRGLNEKN